MNAANLLEKLKRLNALADIGLLYSSTEYDKERYAELKEITDQLMEDSTGQNIETIRLIYPEVKDYPTVKVDLRGLVISEEKKILMVKESKDQKWSLPGGWAEIGYSPKENIIKEFKEETGLDVVPKKLLAVFDKRKHPHPPQSFYIYKMIFHCEIISGEMQKGFDVLDVQYFDMDHLPELSEDRILKSQIQLLNKKVLSDDLEVYFD